MLAAPHYLSDSRLTRNYPSRRTRRAPNDDGTPRRAAADVRNQPLLSLLTRLASEEPTLLHHLASR